MTDRISVGDLYEDCAFQPVLCTRIAYEADEIEGISLFDGTAPRACSLTSCGVRKITVAEAVQLRLDRLQERRSSELLPWERNDPHAFRITVRLIPEEWAAVEDAIEAVDSDQARELLYRITEQTGNS